MPRYADLDLRASIVAGYRRGQSFVRAHPRLSAAAAVVLGLAAAWLFLVQGGPDDSLEKVRQSGVLRVGLEATFPPFETTDGQGNFGGYDIEVAEAIAAEIGVRARFDNLSYDTLYDALAVRRVDVLISMIIVEKERTMDVTYSPAYYDAGQVLVAAEGTALTGTVGLAGRRVAVEAGSMAEEEARRLAGTVPGFAIATFSEPGPALAAMARGDADAAIADPITLAAFRRAGGKAVVVGERLSSEPYVVAVRREDRSLSQEVERIVNLLRERGELEKLAAKWF